MGRKRKMSMLTFRARRRRRRACALASRHATDRIPCKYLRTVNRTTTRIKLTYRRFPKEIGRCRSSRQGSQSHARWRGRVCQVARAQEARNANRRSPGCLQPHQRLFNDFQRKGKLTSSRWPIRERNPEPNTPLNDKQLSRPHHQLAHLSLHIQQSLLRQDAHIAIVVAECLVSHALIGRIHVDGSTLTKRGIAVTGHGFQTTNEIGGFGWDGRSALAETKT